MSNSSRDYSPLGNGLRYRKKLPVFRPIFALIAALVAALTGCNEDSTTQSQASSTCSVGFYSAANGRCARWSGSNALVHMDQSFVSFVGNETTAKMIVANAIEAWVHPMSDFKLTLVEDSPGQIEIYGVPVGSWTADPSYQAYTVVQTDAAGSISSAKMYFNETTPYSVTPENGKFDLSSAVLHEMGHALGMAHNNQDRKSVMYPTVTQAQTRSITYGDWWNLWHVYQLRYVPVPPPK